MNLKDSRGYRNPSYLSLAVKNFDIDQYGSAYPPDIFDPHDLNPEVRAATQGLGLKGTHIFELEADGMCSSRL